MTMTINLRLMSVIWKPFNHLFAYYVKEVLMRSILICFFILLIGCASQKQLTQGNLETNNKPMQKFIEYCKTAMCRKNLTIKLKQADGKYYVLSRRIIDPESLKLTYHAIPPTRYPVIDLHSHPA